MKHFCIIANQAKDENKEHTNRIATYLTKRGAQVFVAEPLSPADTSQCFKDNIPDFTECAVVLGGDGTFLHVAKALEPKGIPVIGINLGNLGFLTTVEIHEAEKVLDSLLRDEFTIVHRPILKAGKNLSPVSFGKFFNKTEKITNPEKRDIASDGEDGWLAMNDVVISRSGYSRLLHFQVFVDGELVSDYQSDGVIISTPTGSTGYSMSAGGPLVAPGVPLVLITPICPHSLHNRPLVVSQDAEITVRMLPTFRSQQEEARITIDGDECGVMDVQETCTIKTSKRQVCLLELPNQSFWNRVRGKL